MDVDVALYTEKLTTFLLAWLPGVLGAVAVLVGGFWLANRADDALERALERSNLSPELRSFFGSMLTIVIKVFVVLTAAGMVGFETASLVAVLAAAGFAVGFALQGSLSNFAAGILILAFRPFKVGDWIGVGDEDEGPFGRVESIQFLSTILVSPGAKTRIVPNAEIVGGVVTNYSAQGVIRLELQVPMAYETSWPEVRAILERVLAEAPYVLADPTPELGIEAFDSHTVTVAVRPYVAPDDFWPATFELNRRVKAALSEAGVPIAYSEGVELGRIGG